MKIIALSKTGYNPHYLVEMKEDELARLRGFHSASTSGHGKVEIGAEYDINMIYSSLKAVGYATDPNYNTSLRSKAKELRELAQNLENLQLNLSELGEKGRKLN